MLVNVRIFACFNNFKVIDKENYIRDLLVHLDRPEHRDQLVCQAHLDFQVPRENKEGQYVSLIQKVIIIYKLFKF